MDAPTPLAGAIAAAIVLYAFWRDVRLGRDPAKSGFLLRLRRAVRVLLGREA